MEGNSPVMTESERRAYRYGQAAAPRPGGGMRTSWSNDSLSSYVGAGSRSGTRPCVCAPTTHPGSFRCKHHRQSTSVLGAAALRAHHEPSAADAGAKQQHGETSSADQEKRSSS